MTKCYKTVLFFGIVVAVVLMQSAWAQTPVSIKFYGTDGSGVMDSLTLIVHPDGTNDTPCQADSISPTEKEAPQGLPPPPQGLDLRVIPFAGYDCLSQYISIHDLVYDTQLDCWKVQFQRDASQTGMDFTWQAGLDTVGAGYWKIAGDPNDVDGVIASLDVDMTQTTQLHLDLGDTDPHTFYVKKGDGAKMRSFTPTEIIEAVDSKGKRGKQEKRKNYANDWCMFFQNTTLDTVNKLHVDFSQKIEVLSSSGWTYAFGTSTKKVDFMAPGVLNPGESIEICGIGDKGKPIKVSKWYWVDALNKPLNKIKYKHLTGGHTVEHDRLWLRMPNINNVGEEAYAQNVWTETYKGKPAGIVIGTQNQAGVTSKGKPYYKFVYHPKWKDVTKTLSDKTGTHTLAATCLDNFTNTKPVLKGVKSLPPKKHNNVLLAEAVALAFNVGIGDASKTETNGFGDLVYVKQGGDPSGLPDGSTVREIDAMMDSVMSCISSRAGTYAEWDSVVRRLNLSFSDNGNFDTLSFGQIQPGKFDRHGLPAGGTIATGVRAVAEVDYLYRTSSEAAPRIIAPLDLRKLEAPRFYELAQNYPNPFNPTTTIEFTLPEDALVTISVYNMLGQKVATLADHEEFTEGANDVTLDASSLASGVYFYRIVAQSTDDEGRYYGTSPFTAVKKMLFVK